MPGYSNQAKHTPPNFVVNSVKGWNTRLLYTFYGNYTSEFDLITLGYDIKANLLSSISTEETNSSTILSKGQYIFPQYSRFFKTGKSIRIKGSLIVSAGGINAKFSIQAAIWDAGNAKTTIAAQNNNNLHTFAAGNDLDNVPVNFEIIYSCVEDDNNNLYMQANGFYEYDIESYNSGGTNITHTYVPIYNSTPYISIGGIMGEYKIGINFESSSNISNIKIRSITIEELS